MATVLGRELMDSDEDWDRSSLPHHFCFVLCVFTSLTLSFLFWGAAYPQERTRWLETRMTTTWTPLLAS